MSCQAEPSFVEDVDPLSLSVDMDATLFDNLEPLLFASF